MRDEPSRPTLVSNPVDDVEFASHAESLLDRAASSPDRLESVLRGRYPRAVVRRREIAGEHIEIWYVYRDGRWTPPRRRRPPVGDRKQTEEDLRATSDAMTDDLARLTELEERKRTLEPDDPRLPELSDEVVAVARRVRDESVAQRELAHEADPRA